MTTDQQFTKDDFREKLSGLRNWGRWGPDDQRGAVNLITQDKVRRAAQLVALGKTVSLAREYPKTPAANNLYPAGHFVRRKNQGDGTSGFVADHLSISYHGQASTHLDALCHVWDGDGMWNGRDPDDEITYDGMTWAGVEHWADGIVTRGVLLDVAAAREKGCVDFDEPVTGDDLTSISDARGLAIEPGDALVIHCGREVWERANGCPWGALGPDGERLRPGLDASCLDFFREVDCSMIVWDMMDATPNSYDVVHPIHSVLFSMGVALLDNALIEPLATECAQSNRTDFLLTVAPLKIVGGTGSPVNPLALL